MTPGAVSLPGFSVHGLLEARILGWVAMSLLPGIFPVQGLNPGLPPRRQSLDCLSHYLEDSQIGLEAGIGWSVGAGDAEAQGTRGLGQEQRPAAGQL